MIGSARKSGVSRTKRPRAGDFQAEANMTRFEKSQSGESFRLLITSNVALSARQSRLIISGLVSYGTAAALVATALGAWPVLPFLGSS